MISTLLMMGLTTEGGLRIKVPTNLIFILLGVTPLLFFQRERLAFNLRVPKTEIPELFILLFLPLISGLVACYLKSRSVRIEEQEEQIGRLDLAVSRLIEANLGYQKYANKLEARTLNKERRRVSREIHDTVGYALTNIRVILEAGAIQIGEAPDKSKTLILQAMEESRLCIEEMRRAMGELRGKEERDVEGYKAIAKLVQSFRSSTGIAVSLEWGTTPLHFSPSHDRLIYRLVQESLTNSFRHGLATEVDISFSCQKEELQVFIRDNGRGAISVKEGLGLTGMKERLERAGGSLEYAGGQRGFQVRAYIPFGEDKNGTD